MDVLQLHLEKDTEIILSEIHDKSEDLYDKTIDLIESVKKELDQLEKKKHANELYKFYLHGLIYCILMSIQIKGNPMHLDDEIDEFMDRIYSTLNRSNKNIVKINYAIAVIYEAVNRFENYLL